MTTENAVAEKRGPQVAIVPISAIDIKDVASGAAVFDAWLQEVSGGMVTLERIQGVAGALPVVGNIMALVDALGDVVTLTKTEKRDLLPANHRNWRTFLWNHHRLQHRPARLKRQRRIFNTGRWSGRVDHQRLGMCRIRQGAQSEHKEHSAIVPARQTISHVRSRLRVYTVRVSTSFGCLSAAKTRLLQSSFCGDFSSRAR